MAWEQKVLGGTSSIDFFAQRTRKATEKFDFTEPPASPTKARTPKSSSNKNEISSPPKKKALTRKLSKDSPQPSRKRRRVSTSDVESVTSKAISSDNQDGVSQAEERALSAEERARDAEKRARGAEKRARESEKRAADAEKRASSSEKIAGTIEKRAGKMEKKLISAEKALELAQAEILELKKKLEEKNKQVEQMQVEKVQVNEKQEQNQTANKNEVVSEKAKEEPPLQLGIDVVQDGEHTNQPPSEQRARAPSYKQQTLDSLFKKGDSEAMEVDL